MPNRKAKPLPETREPPTLYEAPRGTQPAYTPKMDVRHRTHTEPPTLQDVPRKKGPSESSMSDGDLEDLQRSLEGT